MVSRIIKLLSKAKQYQTSQAKRSYYPTNKKQTVFVTGDLGKLGSIVTKKLSKKYNIVGFDIVASPLESISNYGQLVRKMKGADYVIHLAGIPHPGSGSIRDYFKANVVGTLNVLEAAKKNNIKKFIYLSSTSFYGCDIRGNLNPLYFPIDEAHPIASREGRSKGELDEYGQSKVMAEQLCAYFGTNKYFEVIVLRSGPANKNEQQYPEDFDWVKNKNYQRGAFWANNDPDNIPVVVEKALASKKKYYYEPFNVVNTQTDSKIPVATFLKKEYSRTPVNIPLKGNPSLIDTRKVHKHFGKILIAE